MDHPSTFKVYNASAGSGKTFTLVKEYLKIILKDANQRSYQHILAITFTNKAAAEMKDRILENLLQFSVFEKGNEENDMLNAIAEETQLDKALIRLRAKERLQDILKNYASFHIKTIDSFTNKLIKSFAFDLGISTDFEVELDTDAILKEAVDIVLSRIGVDKDLTALLVSYAKDKTLEDKSWDIGKDLFEVSKLILNENHTDQLKTLSSKSIDAFSSLSQKLRKEQQLELDLLREIGSSALKHIDEIGINVKDFYRSQFPNFFQKMIDKPEGLDFDESGSLARNIESRNFYAKSKAQDIKSAIDGISELLIDSYKEAASIFQRIKLNELILKNLVPLAVINTINQSLEEIKTNNNIRLNAEFNQLISNHLINEPAAFIYEKLGERFKYFFIDEMQDTSVLQWQNLIPLIDNALSAEGAGLMLVGDAKQAIYRWRGGRAEQFIDLSSAQKSQQGNPFQTSKLALNLETNYRSHQQIIEFNNMFFSHISQHFAIDTFQELYQLGSQQKTNSKKGGYVNLQFLEAMTNNDTREEVYPKEVYNTVVQLLQQYEANEICILVRKKKEGASIAKYLTEQGIDIISSETLLIKNNQRVNFVINLLKMIQDDSNKEARFEVLDFLFDHFDIKGDRHDFIRSLIHLPSNEFFLYFEVYDVYYEIQAFNDYSILEGVEDIIRSFRLTKESDAFLQFFLDFVFDYTQRKSQKNTSFIEYWEEKNERLNIVSSEDVKAVRIMTIHKSKGLEFPVVIFPYNLDIYYEKDPKAWYEDLSPETYNDFESILINSSSGIKNTGKHGKAIFEAQQADRELDSFNLLYVCLTRAVEQLYIISELKKSSGKLGTSSQLLEDYLKSLGLWEENRLEYSFGDKQRISAVKRTEQMVELQKNFISSSWKDHQIQIVANSDLRWDKERSDAIGYGNLIHEMMATVIDEFDIEKTVETAIIKGVINDLTISTIRKLILEIVRHPMLKSYFSRDLTVYNEREILTDYGQIVIPDRLVFDQNKVTIIDYKTGIPSKNHELQVQNYGLVLEKLSFEVVNKLLVYIDDKITVVKVE